MDSKDPNVSENNNSEQKDPSRQYFTTSFANEQHQVPEIALPKGGGALKGIDEKFEVNPVNGTNSVTIPLPISPARAGFSPSLSISYSSGQGNGLFGFGWNMSLPAIRRKTDRGLPLYKDNIESDTFIFSGAEDLIPKLYDNSGTWEPVERVTATHRIKQYRPRIEGSWVRIEQWIDLTTQEIHWRTISTTNVVTVYGDTTNSRIANPENPASEIFEWLISYSYDNRGNLIQYEYKEEKLERVSNSIFEKNRSIANVTNRYLKRVHYGNQTHYHHGDALLPDTDFLFETVFDYGEHAAVPTPAEVKEWNVRQDPFSNFRAGFDIRTYRLCERVLLFHKFAAPTDQPIANLLVTALEFDYKNFPGQQISALNLEGFVYLKKATSRGYLYNDTTGNYDDKIMPPLSFYYQEHEWNTTIQDIDQSALENAPVGLNNNGYRWTDFHGEGISGILLEDNNAWYYKENLGLGTFGPSTLLENKPSFSGLEHGMVQFQDLEGDGERQLVSWADPKGFYAYKDGDQWDNFQYFEAVPNRNFNDPNTRFIDLDGDGRADILITENDIFQWHSSKGKTGFGEANTITQALDEEDGPRIVFADAEQSIYLADMSGDGMTDIVRIENGAVCYWANKGYGKFSKKIVMEHSPTFDSEDAFNPRYIKLTDIDGSGTTDIVYMKKDSIHIWMNHSGNRWAQAPEIIEPFPTIDSEVNVDCIDFLGTGTSCIVWSSAGAKDFGQPLRYIDLTNSKKPHLLNRYENNTGSEVLFEYKSSTHYYLEDKKAGKPWATKLPFPVYVVSKTQARDYIRNTIFTTKYSYHHGYYDRLEREFRGFGRVETLDTEDFNVLEQVQAGNINPEHFQLPVKTISWYHTGASFKNDTLANAYQAEYYQNPSVEQALNGVKIPQGLDDQAYHEAYRTCKGLALRQEVYTLDTDNPNHVHPYSASESSYEVKLVQPTNGQEYASFVVVPTQSMSYGYERNSNDPRIAQDLVLATDDLGIPTETVSIIYRRLNIPSGLPWMVKEEQRKTHAVYKQIALTNDVDTDDSYRLRTGYEEKMYELLGLNWTPTDAYYSIEDINQSLAIVQNVELNFEQDYSAGSGVQKRLSGHGRMEYLKDDLSAVLPLGTQEALGVAGKSYQLAYTAGSRQLLLKTAGGIDLLQSAGLDQPAASGYIDLDGDQNWWIPSGETIYPTGAASNFYIPSGMRDALGTETNVFFDSYQLMPVRTEDALLNRTEAIYDYRTLRPKLMTDANQNRMAVSCDELGIVVKSAVMGKIGQNEGDTLEHPTAIMMYDFLNWMDNRQPNYIHTAVREEHHSYTTANNLPVVWQESYEYSDGGGNVIMTKVQTKDGLANSWNNGLVRQVDTTSLPTKRWIGNGRTILDNKGNPIKQYEPYFSDTYEYEDEEDLVQVGVTPILYYDAAGRNIRTELPNKTFTKVEFDAWHTKEYDTNDTVLESDWYQDLLTHHAAILNGSTEPTDPELRAAWLTKEHANTPSVMHMDCLGRTIYGEVQKSDGTTQSAVYTQTDLAGRFSKVYDEIATAQLITAGSFSVGINRSIASYGRTNILGQEIYTQTAAKGEAWVFIDILGRLMRGWDNMDNPQFYKVIRSDYDPLHRPLKTYVQQGSNPEICVAKTSYGESLPVAQAVANNLRGQAYQGFDQSGVLTTESIDFKGNPLRITRQLVEDYVNDIDWDQNPNLEADVFETVTSYDGLNRPRLTTLPDQTKIESTYNEGAYLEALKVQILGSGPWIDFMKGQEYDAKGQRQYIKYGNDTITNYFYDAYTFRLSNLVTTHTNTEKLQDIHYTYDPVGNITEVKDEAQSTFFYQNQAIAPQKRYEYDDRYRLLKATGREHAGAGTVGHQDLAHLANMPHNNIANAVRQYTQLYQYDNVGNILQMTHQAGAVGSWSQMYNYDNNDASNRLLDTVIGSNTYQYNQYDIHGNMTKMPHLHALNWDFQDQLKTVDLNTSGDRACYNYDGGGQRVRKVIDKNGKKIKERLYLGGVERYREYNLIGTVTLERWTLQIDDLAQVDTETINVNSISNPTPLIRYQYRDHLGSATVEANEVGQVISYEEYHPYGTSAYRTEKSGTNLSLKRYRFTNKERDDETGLYYFGVRYYAAWLGRWTSSDPEDFVDGLNLYRYVRNNPVMLIDPDGTNSEPINNKDDGDGEKNTAEHQSDEEMRGNGYAYFIAFTDFKISVPGLGKVSGLGHAGILLIDSDTGEAKYYDYGRYDKAAVGLARDKSKYLPKVEIGEDGKPKIDSLNEVLNIVSQKAGKKGRISAVEIPTSDLESMNNFALKELSNNSNPNRAPYTILGRNCGTWACDVANAANDVNFKKINSSKTVWEFGLEYTTTGSVPKDSPTPINQVRELQKIYTSVEFDSRTKTTTRDKEKSHIVGYKPEEEEAITEKEEIIPPRKLSTIEIEPIKSKDLKISNNIKKKSNDPFAPDINTIQVVPIPKEYEKKKKARQHVRF